MAARKAGKAVPKAVLAVRRSHTGDWQGAVDELTTLAGGGDAAASAALVPLLAARGRWRDVVAQAEAFLAQPDVATTANVFEEVCRIVRRAQAELGDTTIVPRLAALVPDSHEDVRDAVLLEETPPRRAPKRAAFDKAVLDAPKQPRFKKRPEELPRHLWALARAFDVDDELVARFDETAAWATFDVVLVTASVLARTGRAAKAWPLISARLGAWLPVDPLQPFPAELITDDGLFALMTDARWLEVLKTPRAQR